MTEALQKAFEIDGIKHQIRYVINDDVEHYCLVDLGNIVQIKNVHHSTKSIPNDDKVKVKTLTNGGQQFLTFVTLNAAKTVLAKSRKVLACKLAKCLGLDILHCHVVSIENETLTNIMTVFKNESMIHQYQVGQHRIDLFFPDFNLAIECDETFHLRQMQHDKKRQEKITALTGCVFIRYSPECPEFNIFEVINQIYVHITNHSMKKTV